MREVVGRQKFLRHPQARGGEEGEAALVVRTLTSEGDFTTEREETPFGDTEVVREKRPSGFFNRITFTYHSLPSSTFGRFEHFLPTRNTGYNFVLLFRYGQKVQSDQAG